jgi:hypothetical protein
MKASLVCVIALVSLITTLDLSSHGRSEQMYQELNAKTPDWLSIGVPIKVEPSNTSAQAEAVFRTRSGGTTNSSNRVQIPTRGIEIRVDYAVDYTGNNEAGTGSSLSPDGTRLIVNSGPSSHLYEILPNGEAREIPLQVPHVTYDAGRKGYLRGWSWVDHQTLIGYAEIDDDAGHEILETRIYVYHIKESTLSRLDLSALNQPANALVEVTKIGRDSDHLLMNVGDGQFMVVADLRPPAKTVKPDSPMPNETALPAAQNQRAPKTFEAKVVSTSSKSASLSTQWIVIIMLVVGVFGVLWFLSKRRK